MNVACRQLILTPMLLGHTYCSLQTRVETPVRRPRIVVLEWRQARSSIEGNAETAHTLDI